jgi:hypothetical protein
MKIKLTQPGWETYSGPMAGAMFENGLADNVTPRVAAKIGNIVQCETEDGENPSMSQQIINSQATNMSAVTLLEAGDKAPKDEVKPARIYTQQELEAIADKRGIDGLREIAKPLGLKGVSIAKLLVAIVEKQGKLRVTQAPAAAADAERLVPLFGSSIQPSEIAVGARKVQLGTVVSEAHKRSGMSVDQWNKAPEKVREDLIAAEIVELRKDLNEEPK